MDKCFGLSHAGHIQKCKDRLMSMVPRQSFAKALMEYMHATRNSDIDETSHKLVNDKFQAFE
jgi:hypothetical protein